MGTYEWDISDPAAYYNKMGFYKTDKQKQFILKHLPPKSKCKILDIGGGSGRFALPLTAAGHEVFVVDKSLEAIERLAKRGFDNAVCCDILNHSSYKLYDVAILIEVMNHFYNLEFIFEKIKSLISKDGIVIFTITNTCSWRYSLRKLRKNKTIYNEYHVKQYFNALNKYNFRIIEIEGYLWMPFTVNSNNVFVPIIAKLEQALKLSRWLNQSPWLLIAIQNNG